LLQHDTGATGVSATPRPGADRDDDIEIIAVSLHLNHTALQAILNDQHTPAAREFGA